MDEITGGSPYGAGTLAKGNGSPAPMNSESPASSGRHVAEIARKLFG